ncbi:uncharacterized protein [Dysidea avara]|uniref:uncharacterized protein n=1 Tax=Dysidea avara TaxID=196820 RepID=UPI00332FBDA6
MVAPKPGRELLLSLLHEGNPGISKMKGLACSYVWWLNIDADIETQVKRCRWKLKQYTQQPLRSPSNICVLCLHNSDYLRQNLIHHVKVAPYRHGLAGRAAQTFKLGMKKQTNGIVQTKLSRSLFHYRLTPNSTTGVAPAKLMLRCQPRSHLDSILPSVKRNVEQQQQKKSQHDAHSKAHVSSRKMTWFWYKIWAIHQIQIDNNHVVQRHTDHIITRKADRIVPNMIDDDDNSLPLPGASSDVTTPPTLRQSQRSRQPPGHFKLRGKRCGSYTINMFIVCIC